MTITEPTPLTLSVALALADLGDCVCAELATTGAGPLCWCGLAPGAAVAWDHCGDCDNDVCGIAWVRLDQMYPSTQFPTPIVEMRCRSPLAYRIEVGAIRCMPVAVDGGSLPPERLAEVTIAQVADAAAMYRAMQCCEAVRVAPEIYTPRGPQGGCVGGLWTAYLEVH